jgi:hypothetical protein
MRLYAKESNCDTIFLLILGYEEQTKADEKNLVRIAVIRGKDSQSRLLCYNTMSASWLKH